MSEELRVEPAVLSATCQSLAGAAEHLLGRFSALDGTVASMLSGWQGSSGGAYGDAWRMWHEGAVDVEKALAIMADLLGEAARGFDANERSSADELRGVYGG